MKKLVFMITAILITTLMIVLIGMMALMTTTPAYASTAACHELVMSYIVHDQDPPQEPGDYLYHEDGTAHRLTATTGYCHGTIGSHGDKMKTGYVAYTPESYGYAMMIYKAVETENGYELGDYIGMYEIRDTGYGKSTGTGKSAVRADKNSRGTIEAGLSVDAYHPTLAECRKWMKETNGMIFIQLIPAKG